MSNLINQRKFKPIFLGVCLTVVFVCLVNPFGVASGNRDVDSYEGIRSLLSETKNAKVAYLSSDEDYFDFKGTSELRDQYGENFALEDANEILSAASFGNWSFNKFLNNNKVTHLLVPINSAERNRVVRKWGLHGNIMISLRQPFFAKKLVTSGEFPVAIYEVAKTKESDSALQPISYRLVWDDGTRDDFYSQIKSQREVGLYTYDYQSRFRDGATVSWVMADESDVSEKPAFKIQADHSENLKFQLTIEILAAYGSFAPNQVVRVAYGENSKSISVSSGKAGRVVLDVKPGEVITFENVLPCSAANTFDLTTSDTRKFCYGLSSITVRPTHVD